MAWNEIMLETKYIADEYVSGSGIFKKKYNYIMVPDKNYEGYAFLLSQNCISYGISEDECSMISIEDDMNIVLLKHPDFKEEQKRYPRYKMSGKELIANILEPYEDDYYHRRLVEENKRAKERERRNKKIMGSIVYGKYKGNYYGASADVCNDFYFYNDKVFYNMKHQKVLNVEILFTIFENVSKDFYEKNRELIMERLSNYIVLSNVEQTLTDLCSTMIEASTTGAEEYLLAAKRKISEEKEEILLNCKKELKNTN